MIRWPADHLTIVAVATLDAVRLQRGFGARTIRVAQSGDGDFVDSVPGIVMVLAELTGADADTS
jgi:hypothetical protein